MCEEKPNFDKAGNYLKDAKNKFQTAGDMHLFSTSNQCLGEMYYMQGRYEKSLSYYKQGLDIQTKIDTKVYRGWALAGIAIAQKKLGLEINYEILNPELAKGPRNFWGDYIFWYLFYGKREYINLAYDEICNISDTLDDKNKEKFLNCFYPKLIVEEWQKVTTDKN